MMYSCLQDKLLEGRQGERYISVLHTMWVAASRQELQLTRKKLQGKLHNLCSFMEDFSQSDDVLRTLSSPSSFMCLWIAFLLALQNVCITK